MGENHGKQHRAGEMAQQVKELFSKADEKFNSSDLCGERKETTPSKLYNDHVHYICACYK